MHNPAITDNIDSEPVSIKENDLQRSLDLLQSMSRSGRASIVFIVLGAFIVLGSSGFAYTQLEPLEREISGRSQEKKELEKELEHLSDNNQNLKQKRKQLLSELRELEEKKLKAEEAVDESLALLQNKKVKEAQQLLVEQQQERNVPTIETIERLIKRGDNAQKSGDTEKAISLYRRAKDLALSYKIDSHEPFARLADIAYKDERWEDAKIRYNQALNRNPNAKDAIYGLARLQILQGEFERAKELVEPWKSKGKFKKLYNRLNELSNWETACTSKNAKACTSIGECLYHSRGRTINAAARFLKEGCRLKNKKACHYQALLERDQIPSGEVL